MNVKLTYFKPTTGKFYAEGDYDTKLKQLFEIADEVSTKNERGDLPGLIDGSSGWIVLMDVPEHEHNHPYLILPEVLFNVIERLAAIGVTLKP